MDEAGQACNLFLVLLLQQIYLLGGNGRVSRGALRLRPDMEDARAVLTRCIFFLLCRDLFDDRIATPWLSRALILVELLLEELLQLCKLVLKQVLLASELLQLIFVLSAHLLKFSLEPRVLVSGVSEVVLAVEAAGALPKKVRIGLDATMQHVLLRVLKIGRDAIQVDSLLQRAERRMHRIQALR